MADVKVLTRNDGPNVYVVEGFHGHTLELTRDEIAERVDRPWSRYEMTMHWLRNLRAVDLMERS